MLQCCCIAVLLLLGCRPLRKPLVDAVALGCAALLRVGISGERGLAKLPPLLALLLRGERHAPASGPGLGRAMAVRQ